MEFYSAHEPIYVCVISRIPFSQIFRQIMSSFDGFATFKFANFCPPLLVSLDFVDPCELDYWCTNSCRMMPFDS